MSDDFLEEVRAGLPENPVERIAALLKRNGIDPADVGRIRSVRVSDWQGLTKNEKGDAEVHDLRGASLVFTPSWDDGPQWPVVQPAAPVKIPAAKPPRKGDGWRRAVVLPDPQIGYRRYEDGTLDPFHDEQAMAVALSVIRYAKPDLIVNLGDFVDLAEFGRFEQEPAFAMTTQAGLDRAHLFLAEQRKAAPSAEIVMLEGNHDRRLQKSIINNAKAAFGLRQANTPESWPVLSMPHLLRLDDLGVTYVEGYPAGEHWINDNLVAIHGAKVRSNGSTAAAVIDDERVSVIFGHVHRIELQHKTRRTRDGAKRNFAATPGCLCRLDGAVPSTKSSTDVFGRPVAGWENWQHGVGVVDYEPGDGRFHLELVPIHDGWAFHAGREFTA